MANEVKRFKRSYFFTGLVATPQFWNEIQDYHLDKERLYNQIFHGHGVVPGVMEELRVSSMKKGGNLTIIVSPGFAIDSQGRGLFLHEPSAKNVDYKKFKLPCTIYVVAKYNEAQEEFFQNKDNPEFQGYKKRLETAVIEITDRQPEDIGGDELARIRLEEDASGDIKEISDARDFANPATNEIDTRFVVWTTAVKRGISPYLRRYLTDILDNARNTATIANDSVGLPGLRELQTVALTAKMLVQVGNVGYDEIINILYPFYDTNEHIIQEMYDYEREKETRTFSEKQSFSDYRTQVYELGELIKYYDFRLETMDKVLKLLARILESIRNIIIARQISFEDLTYVSFELPRVLVVGDDRYTQVSVLDFNNFDTEKVFNLNMEGAQDYSSSNQVFTYPDGVEVSDTVKRYVGGSISFDVRNLIRKRELLMIRRTDVFHGDYRVAVSLNDVETRNMTIDGYDTTNRWRNLYVRFEEEHIQENEARIKIKMEENGRDNFGTIWFYQKV